MPPRWELRGLTRPPPLCRERLALDSREELPAEEDELAETLGPRAVRHYDQLRNQLVREEPRNLEGAAYLPEVLFLPPFRSWDKEASYHDMSNLWLTHTKEMAET